MSPSALIHLLHITVEFLLQRPFRRGKAPRSPGAAGPWEGASPSRLICCY